MVALGNHTSVWVAHGLPKSRAVVSGRSDAESGFTLVELTVALIVVGFVTGAVLMGRSLVHAAEIRRLAGQLEAMQVAVTSFRRQYAELPGDFSGATVLWPDDDPGDGNGDGRIDAVWPEETYAAWKHLALAGLYQSEVGDASMGSGTWVPKGALEGSYINVLYDEWPSGTERIGNFLTVTSIPVAVSAHGYLGYLINYGMGGPACGLVPDKAQALDQKTDDGLPLSGRIVSAMPQLGSDKMSCPHLNGENEYNVQSLAFNCGLWARLVWGE